MGTKVKPQLIKVRNGRHYFSIPPGTQPACPPTRSSLRRPAKLLIRPIKNDKCGLQGNISKDIDPDARATLQPSKASAAPIRDRREVDDLARNYNPAGADPKGERRRCGGAGEDVAAL